MADEVPEGLVAYRASLTGSALWDYGFDADAGVLCPDLAAVIDEELALPSIPGWAREIMVRMIAHLPICGHYTFPAPIVSVCRAIHLRRCPEIVCGHYTCDFGRKTLMSYYVFCLDAWLQNAPRETAKAELLLRDALGRDWPTIVDAIYDTLGTPNDLTRLLVERVVHRERWWVKTLIWPDDRRDRFGLDMYGGDVRGDEARFSAYGNSPYGDPYFAELRVPRVVELSERIRKAGHGELLGYIEHSHLCGPKAFRILERLIVAIGNLEGPLRPNDAPSVLQCEDTYPDLQACGEWYSTLMASLDAWLAGDADALPELGPVTDVTHWLGSALRYHLTALARSECDPFARLVGTSPAGKSGTRPILRYLGSG